MAEYLPPDNNALDADLDSLLNDIICEWDEAEVENTTEDKSSPPVPAIDATSKSNGDDNVPEADATSPDSLLNSLFDGGDGMDSDLDSLFEFKDDDNLFGDAASSQTAPPQKPAAAKHQPGQVADNLLVMKPLKLPVPLKPPSPKPVSLPCPLKLPNPQASQPEQTVASTTQQPLPNAPAAAKPVLLPLPSSATSLLTASQPQQQATPKVRPQELANTFPIAQPSSSTLQPQVQPVAKAGPSATPAAVYSQSQHTMNKTPQAPLPPRHAYQTPFIGIEGRTPPTPEKQQMGNTSSSTGLFTPQVHSTPLYDRAFLYNGSILQGMQYRPDQILQQQQFVQQSLFAQQQQVLQQQFFAQHQQQSQQPQFVQQPQAVQQQQFSRPGLARQQHEVFLQHFEAMKQTQLKERREAFEREERLQRHVQQQQQQVFETQRQERQKAMMKDQAKQRDLYMQRYKHALLNRIQQLHAQRSGQQMPEQSSAAAGPAAGAAGVAAQVQHITMVSNGGDDAGHVARGAPAQQQGGHIARFGGVDSTLPITINDEDDGDAVQFVSKTRYDSLTVCPAQLVRSDIAQLGSSSSAEHSRQNSIQSSFGSTPQLTTCASTPVGSESPPPPPVTGAPTPRTNTGGTPVVALDDFGPSSSANPPQLDSNGKRKRDDDTSNLDSPPSLAKKPRVAVPRPKGIEGLWWYQVLPIKKGRTVGYVNPKNQRWTNSSEFVYMADTAGIYTGKHRNGLSNYIPDEWMPFHPSVFDMEIDRDPKYNLLWHPVYHGTAEPEVQQLYEREREERRKASGREWTSLSVQERYSKAREIVLATKSNDSVETNGGEEDSKKKKKGKAAAKPKGDKPTGVTKKRVKKA